MKGRYFASTFVTKKSLDVNIQNEKTPADVGTWRVKNLQAEIVKLDPIL